ncbi:MAG TPA: hypothetical protein VIE42_08570 [Steroidobacteraceae bacterium]|jgi:predicted ABC-type ATPase
MNRPNHKPRCIVIAGPNGAGKTTFAREYLPKVAGVIQFVNADLIAQGLSQGGHDVPRADVLRRFARGWENFERVYRPLADAWTLYDNSGKLPRLTERWS